MVMFSAPPLTLRPNAGGALTAEQVIGRDELIDRYWDLLERTGLVLLAPRRVGKSSICNVMKERPRSGFTVCALDVERCDSAARFVSDLRAKLGEALVRSQARYLAQATRAAARRVKKLSFAGIGVEVDSNAGTWLDQLDATLGAAESAGSALEANLVLIWDELPLFIDKLANSGRPQEAVDLLDALRAHRQHHPASRLRMVYVGSIGLPEVLDRLRESIGYRGSPTNDMATERVPLLQPDAAETLAAALLWSLERPDAREADFVRYVAARGERHPYLIQWVVSELQLSPPHTLTHAEVDRVLAHLQNDDLDRLDLEHYLGRLGDGERGQDARRILDQIAPTGPAGLGAEALRRLLADAAPARIADALRVLRRDGYLERDDDDTHRFVLQILARWWVRRRGLR